MLKRPPGPSSRERRTITVTVGGRPWCAEYRPRRGVSVFTPRDLGSLAAGVSVDCPDDDGDAMKCPSLPAAGDDGPDGPDDVSKLLKGLPHVAEFLGKSKWEDGVSKGQRVLMVFIDKTSTRALFKVEKQALKFSAVGRNLDDALAAAEVMLRTGEVVWEQDGQAKGPQRKKSA